MWSTNFIESFNCAIEGFFYVIKTQRNMRIHFLLAALLFILGIVLDFTRFELISLGIIIGMVLFAEMVNTAIEHTIDLISDSFHPLARIIKDISAGSVLLTAIVAATCGYLLFSRHVNLSIVSGLNRIKDSPLHITIIALIIVFSLVMLIKILFKRGTPLRGGMPSGHAALAFAVWTIIVFSTSNPLIISLSLILAIVVARSRLSQDIHTILEVVLGSLLGFLVTLLIIQFFRMLK